MVAMQTLIVQFVFSFVIALLLGYPAGMLATYFGIMDIPGSALVHPGDSARNQKDHWG